MFVMPALSSPPVQGEQVAPGSDGGVVRLANELECPVESPVHALQRELGKLDALKREDDSLANRAPGWLRIALPLAMSIGLWIVLIGIFRALAGPAIV